MIGIVEGEHLGVYEKSLLAPLRSVGFSNDLFANNDHRADRQLADPKTGLGDAQCLAHPAFVIFGQGAQTARPHSRSRVTPLASSAPNNVSTTMT
jgi:hypothetical protein